MSTYQQVGLFTNFTDWYSCFSYTFLSTYQSYCTVLTSFLYYVFFSSYISFIMILDSKKILKE